MRDFQSKTYFNLILPHPNLSGREKAFSRVSLNCDRRHTPHWTKRLIGIGFNQRGRGGPAIREEKLVKKVTLVVEGCQRQIVDASTVASGKILTPASFAPDAFSLRTYLLLGLALLLLMSAVSFPRSALAEDCPVNQHITRWANEVGREWITANRYPYCPNEAGTPLQSQFLQYYGSDAISQAKAAIVACSPSSHYDQATFTYTLAGFDAPVARDGYLTIDWHISIDGPYGPYSPQSGNMSYRCDCYDGYYKDPKNFLSCLPGYFVAPPPTPAPPVAAEGKYCPVCQIPGDPVNPSSGGELLTEEDASTTTSTPLRIARYYNSIDTLSTSLSPGWRGSFSRQLKFDYTFPQFTPQALNVSHGYQSPIDACYSGWTAIRPYVPGRQSQSSGWNSSTNTCLLSDGTVLPVF